jgi:hypothetical protein
VTYFAGETSIASGTSSVLVNLSGTMPSTSYAVTVTFGSDATFSGGTLPTLVVTGQTATSFTITAYNASNAAVTAPVGGAIVNWTAIANN